MEDGGGGREKEGGRRGEEEGGVGREKEGGRRGEHEVWQVEKFFQILVAGHAAVAMYTHSTSSSILAGVWTAFINVGLAVVTRVARLTCACVAVDTILVCVCE